MTVFVQLERVLLACPLIRDTESARSAQWRWPLLCGTEDRGMISGRACQANLSWQRPVRASSMYSSSRPSQIAGARAAATGLRR